MSISNRVLLTINSALETEPNHPLGKKGHGLERKIFRGGKISSFIASGTNFPD